MARCSRRRFGRRSADRSRLQLHPTTKIIPKLLRSREIVNFRRKALSTRSMMTETSETPVYGRFRVAAKDYYLGARTQVSPERTVLDWETAPLAEVFFA